MLTHTELLELIEEVQHLHSELDDVEVKTAQGGTPQRLFEVLSAFANRPGGGLLLLGLDERRAFQVVGVGDAHRLQEEISHLAAADMEPPLRPEFTVAEIDGHTVVAVEIFEIPIEQKPCYFRPAGLQRGARTQPAFDGELVLEGTLADLNRAALDIYLAQLRWSRPQASYLGTLQK